MPSFDALVFLPQQSHRPSLFDVAGRPLIARQIQWLRASGCRRIAVEIDGSPEALTLADWLERDELGVGVELALTSSPEGPKAAAFRLGWTSPFLALSADVLCSFDASQLIGRPSTEGILPGNVHVAYVDPTRREDSRQAMILRGLGRRLRTEDEAFAVGLEAMTGALYASCRVAWRVPMHAAERSPGVWVARGAHVDAGAVLTAPVYVGPRAFVEAHAEVGPGAVVGADVVVPRGSRVRHRLLTGAPTATPRAPRASLLGRALAWLLMAIVWPIASVRSPLQALIRGDRPWLGLAADRAILPIDRGLVGGDPSPRERARAGSWYRANATPALALHALARSLVRPTPAHPEIP